MNDLNAEYPERRAMLDAALAQLRRTTDVEGDMRRRWHEEHPGPVSRRYLDDCEAPS